MTYGIANLLGVSLARPVTILPGWQSWPKPLQSLYTYAIGAHLSHTLDFLVALAFYLLLWPRCLAAAGASSGGNNGLADFYGFDLSLGGWVAQVLLFNLACEFTLVGFWHSMTYGGGRTERDTADEKSDPLAKFKYNKKQQYGPQERADGSDHLSREIFYQTLGWVQAAALQCVMVRMYALGRLGPLAAAPFFAGLGGAWPTSAAALAATLANAETQRNIFSMALVTYWREIHFYFCHRMIHPWSGPNPRSAPWWDLGAALYTHAHSVHHKSTNPGPWSGMSMHPVEHFFYFQCAWLPFVALAVPSLYVHPMHFLYAIFHACVAPIAGHDGYASPGGGADYHYLHHAYLECA